MKYLRTKLLATKLLWLLLALGVAANIHAQALQKVADLYWGQDGDGTGGGISAPECHFTLIGTNLWFTGNTGGTENNGAVGIFNPYDNTVTPVASAVAAIGTKPQAASIVVANGKGWFTCSAVGAGNKGSLCTIDLTNHTVAPAFSFPNTGPLGALPRATPVQIGDDLWFPTGSGGVAPDGSTTYGTVVKYSLTTGALTNMFTLDNTNLGKIPIGNSFIQAGNDYYLLVFQGGTNVIAGINPAGAGVLDRLSFNSSQQPVLSKVADLPGYYASLPPGDPVYDGTNFLYFNTVGVSTAPGAIVRYNLATSNLTTLFVFLTNAVAVTNFGKQPYGTPVLYGNELYFTTFAGGTAGKGVIDKLSLSNNVVTKLADLEGGTGMALGGAPMYGGGTLYTNPVDCRICIYFPVKAGGVNGGTAGYGTIVRVGMAPPPIVARLQPTAGGMQLRWTGGYSPFSVDAKLASFTGAWTTNWAAGLATNALILPADAPEAYFRIQGTNQ